MKSNICIKSNIYINYTGSSSDAQFIAKIFDPEALRIMKHQQGTLSLWRFSDEQEKVMDCNYECALDKSGDKSLGIDKSTGEFVCKCEYNSCKYFNDGCTLSKRNILINRK